MLRQIFDTVRDHLLRQNAKSLIVTEKGDLTCAYRGDGGLKCAAGCLVPDEDMKCIKEGRSVLTNHYFAQLYTGEELHFISYLQYIHDFYQPYEWPAELAKLEEKYFGTV